MQNNVEQISNLKKQLVNEKNKHNETKHLLNTVLENVPSGVGLFSSKDHIYIHINQTLADINGLLPIEHIGHPCSKILPDAYPFLKGRLDDVLNTGIKRSPGEIILNLKNGVDEERCFVDSYFPLTNLKGVIYGVGCVVYEISNLKKTETELKNANKKLSHETDEKLEAQDNLLKTQQQLSHLLRVQSIGEMVSCIAHELNQPLTSIVQIIGGCLIRLKDKNYPQDIIDALKLVEQQAEKAGAFVHQVKTFLKQDSINIQNHFINDVIENSITMLSYLFKQSNIQINFIKKTYQKILQIDNVLIEQVIINILLNAHNALENKASNRKIFITTKQNKTHGYIYIENNGDLIPDDKRDAIFKPFYSTTKSGMGLGLSICKTIMEIHYGEINLVKNVNGSVKFEIKMVKHDKK